jgi:hypothetical protein
MHSLYKLEDLIMNVWSQKEAIQNLRWLVLDAPDGPPSEDDIDNALLGIMSQLDIGCQRLFAEYENILKENFRGEAYDSDNINLGHLRSEEDAGLV